MMNPIFEVVIIVLGVAITGLMGTNTYILADMKSWLKGLNDRFNEHVEDDRKHCSPEKLKQHGK